MINRQRNVRKISKSVGLGFIDMVSFVNGVNKDAVNQFPALTYQAVQQLMVCLQWRKPSGTSEKVNLKLSVKITQQNLQLQLQCFSSQT